MKISDGQIIAREAKIDGQRRFSETAPRSKKHALRQKTHVVISRLIKSNNGPAKFLRGIKCFARTVLPITVADQRPRGPVDIIIAQRNLTAMHMPCNA